MLFKPPFLSDISTLFNKASADFNPFVSARNNLHKAHKMSLISQVVFGTWWVNLPNWWIIALVRKVVVRVTQVTKVFPKVTLKGRVFHPDSNDVHISSLIWIPNYQGLFNAWPIFWSFSALWTSGPIFMAAILWRMIKNCFMAKFYSKPFPVQKQPLKNL